jgi:hypothetical protein
MSDSKKKLESCLVLLAGLVLGSSVASLLMVLDTPVGSLVV